jgi:hypothetical protein
VSVDVTTETTIECDPAVVADYAVDPDNAREWYANIESAAWVTDPPLAVGSRFAFVARFLGRRLAYTYEVRELDLPHRFVMSTDEGPLPMETTYSWSAADAGGTRMSLRNRGVPAGFSRAFAPLMVPAMRRATARDLSRLKDLLEA